jgi:hypothetical protein
VNLRCESRGGNPAPNLKWFLNDEELVGGEQVGFGTGLLKIEYAFSKKNRFANNQLFKNMC